MTHTADKKTWFITGGSSGLGAALCRVALAAGALGDWKVAANSDGNPDVLMQNNLGQIFAFTMTGAGKVAKGMFVSGAALGDWRLR
jgi:NAD(P)-dependent dehydrogenase (short-subunit alcohol dehydrogenase family)